MTGEELDEIARAAELHDVGKVGIPDAILDKPAAPRPTEWEFMRQHTILGERILSAAPALRPVARLVRSTHERWDGTGYPDRLAATDIPPRRAHRRGVRRLRGDDLRPRLPRALSHEAACQELRAMAGTQFDPRSSRRSSPRSPRSPCPSPTARAPARRCRCSPIACAACSDQAKLAPCPPSPAASTAAARRRRPLSHPARPVPDARLPGALGRPDAPHAAGRVELHDPRAVDEPRHLDLGGVPRAARRDVHRRHPLRDEVVQARHDVDRRLGRHAARGRRDRGRVRHRWCDGGYTTNLPLEDLSDGKAWVVYTYGGEPLDPEHGGPARLLVPHLYFWKSAKWVRGLDADRRGRAGLLGGLGYHNYGDPWREQRYWGD